MKKYILVWTHFVIFFSLIGLVSCDENSRLSSNMVQEITTSMSIPAGAILEEGSLISIEFEKSQNYESARPDFLKISFRDPISNQIVKYEERAIVRESSLFDDSFEDEESEDPKVAPPDLGEGFSPDAEGVEDEDVDLSDEPSEGVSEDDLDISDTLIDSILLNNGFGQLEEEIFLPSLPPGLYIAELEIYEDGLVVSAESVSFYANIPIPRITGISSYPSIAFPGGDCKFSLNASGLVPDSLIVWSVDGAKLYSSSVADGGLVFYWDVPDYEKIYEITAEVYPVNPFPFNLDFKSYYNIKTTSIVSSEQLADQNEFVESDSYSSLYHFRGETRDVLGSKDLQKRGKLFVGAFKGLNGYLIKKESGMFLEQSQLPLSLEFFNPFTLSFKIDFKSLEAGDFYRVSSDGGEFSFKLGLSASRRLFSEITIGESIYSSSFFEVRADFSQVISFSLSSYGNVVWLNAYQNGLMIGYEQIVIDEFPQDLSLLKFNTELFGSQDVIVDELGVYVRNSQGLSSVKEDVFLKFALGRNSNKVLYVDSFDRVDIEERSDAYSVYLSFLHPGIEPYSFTKQRDLLFANVLYLDLLDNIDDMDGLCLRVSTSTSDSSSDIIGFRIKGRDLYVNSDKVFSIDQPGNIELSFIRLEDSSYRAVLNGIRLDDYPLEVENTFIQVDIQNCTGNENLKIDTLVVADASVKKDIILNGFNASFTTIE
ncbi:MAG: hypothetical protein JXR63_04350 [Spirochaetales bacterium]|nr:hypothetical protein [Spirochaetales bacterium]